MSSSRQGYDRTLDPSSTIPAEFAAVSPNRSASFDAQTINTSSMHNAMWESQQNHQGWEGGNQFPVNFNGQYNPAMNIDPTSGLSNGMPMYLREAQHIRENAILHQLGPHAQRDEFYGHNAMVPNVYPNQLYEQLPTMSSYPIDQGKPGINGHMLDT
jgi:hypothetical protein